MLHVTDMTAKRAELTPDHVAFVDDETGRELTFAAVNERAERLARGLLSLGAREGDRIGILCHNRPDFFVFLFACQKARLILVPLNWRQPPAELLPLVEQADITILAVDGAFQAVADALAKARKLLRLGMEPDVAAEADLETLIAECPAGPLDTRPVSTTDPWYLLYTSGTTGLPKAVIQTPAMAWANTVNYAQAVDLVSTDWSLNFLPLFHTGGINLPTLPLFLMGGRSRILRKFDAGDVLDLVDRGEVTSFFGVPAIYQAMALHERFADTDFSAVRSFACGGAPLPEPLIRTFAARGGLVCNGMGMTETGPTVFLNDRAHAESKIGSVGKPQMLAETRIVAADGAVIDGAGEGELQIRGPGVTPGYRGNREATEAAFTEDGWLKTGDVARRDADGYYFIVDRIKDMYISGGENVYPAEVERVLVAFDGVLEAAVIGVADERWGEVGEAFLIARPDMDIDVEALPAWCREQLAAYKIPKRYHVVADMPRTAAGKIQKHMLRKLVP
ncbi:AMP-binding protein [Microbaculum marinisediminis]|uniref:3-methylmercaptopropionyl-CoA ligase n=1 Tax=Microbaculum marinisediminis TaxID=2931392 RepID=A0AAW5R030_9HYPH|nr:AMP-binding protein [Microbaculum sp. A6E488]MCT8972742.1 AMP-binding protein [Microbaculum sp. A6E488]